MKVHFHLHYGTNPGETLHVLLYREGALANENKINIPLTNTTDDLWTGEIQLLLDRPVRLSYHYEVRSGSDVHRRESQRIARVLALAPEVENYSAHDLWRDAAADEQAKERLGLTGEQLEFFRAQKLPVFPRTVVLKACSTRPQENESLWIIGSGDGLGNWDTTNAKLLRQVAPEEWAVALDAAALSFPAEYKFLVRPTDGNDGAAVWEEGPNHVLAEVSLQEKETVIYSDFRPVFSAK